MGPPQFEGKDIAETSPLEDGLSPEVAHAPGSCIYRLEREGIQMRFEKCHRVRRLLLVGLLSSASSLTGLFAQAVLTRSYNDLRSGANTQEQTLTPANVGSLKVLRLSWHWMPTTMYASRRNPCMSPDTDVRRTARHRDRLHHGEQRLCIRCEQWQTTLEDESGNADQADSQGKNGKRSRRNRY